MLYTSFNIQHAAPCVSPPVWNDVITGEHPARFLSPPAPPRRDTTTQALRRGAESAGALAAAR